MAVCVGPEFEADPSGRLRLVICGEPAEQAWPYDCGADLENPVRVDPACGVWIPPYPKMAVVTSTGSTIAGSVVVPGAFTTVETATTSIDNPSWCHVASVLHFVQVDIDLFLPPGADATAATRVNNNEIQRITNPAPGSGTNADNQHVEITVPIPGTVTVPPGGVQNYSFPIDVGGGTGGARYEQIRWQIKTLVFAGLT